MRNKKKNRIFLLLILLLGISIGFAALATTLKINGSASITKNNWNIYWDNIANQKGVTPTTCEIVDEDTTHKKNIVNFEVVFDKPGDYYEFEVDAVNAGTIDAEVLSIEKKYNDTVIPASGTSPLPSYLKYEVTYADGSEISVGDSLVKAPNPTATPPVYTTKTYKVRVEYDKNAVTNSDVNTQTADVTCTFNLAVNYGQSTTPAGPVAVSFSTDSWDVIAEEGNRAAEQTTVTNNKCGAYNVGDTKEIEMDFDGDNTPETYTLRITNCSTPAVCSTEGFSQTACGFVVEFNDVITSRRFNPYEWEDNPIEGHGNSGGWEKSDMRAYINSSIYVAGNIDYSTTGIYNKLPQDLKNVIKNTRVVSGHGRNDSTHGNFITSDKLYLLSIHEVWEDNDGSPNSGLDSYDAAYMNSRQLDYYLSHGASSTEGTSTSAIKKKLDNTVYTWWLRSSNSLDNGYVFYVYTNGNFALNGSNGNIGVSPAFKISNTKEGWILTNSLTPLIDQQWEYWDNGTKIESGWRTLNDMSGNPNTYYFRNGYAYHGWLELDGNKYYLSTFDDDNNGIIDGRRFNGETREIDGANYTFDANGVCTNCS